MPINNYCYLANGSVENVEEEGISIISNKQNYCLLIFSTLLIVTLKKHCFPKVSFFPELQSDNSSQN